MKPEGYHGRPRTEMFPFVPDNPGRVLDVGCGAGAVGHALKEQTSCEVWGIELDPVAAGLAAEVLDRVLVGDVNSLLDDLPQGTFQTILLLDVLEHVPEPGILLQSLAPLLAPGGKLVASIPNVRYFFNVADLAVHGRWDYTDEGILDRTHLRFFTRSSMETLFKDHGYLVETTAGINPTGSLKFKLFNLITLGAFADMRYLQFAWVVRKDTDDPA
jgi:SAM-dependent methyltransferase